MSKINWYAARGLFILQEALITVFLMSGLAYAGNYTLTIDENQYDIAFGREQVVRLSDGRKLRLKLDKKAIFTFKTENFSFDHPSWLSPSRAYLGGGVQQTMMASPHGTLVLVQEYETMNLPGLADMVLNSVTKKKVRYGYKITKQQASKTLADGTKVTGKMAVSTYRGKEITRYALCYGMRDARLVIFTQFETGSPAQDEQIIKLFWKTMKVLNANKRDTPDKK